MAKYDKTDCRIASKLTDVTQNFQWYSLQVPGLNDLQPRVGHALVSLTEGKVLMIGGGNHSGALNEVISINLEADQETGDQVAVKHHPAEKCFPSRYEFFCAKDSKENCAWVFGGADQENTTNEIIKIDDKTITTVKLKNSKDKDSEGVIPCPRTQGSSSALVEYQDKHFIAVFAGGLKGEQPVQDRDLYLFDVLELEWRKINSRVDSSLTDLPFACQPPSVQGHAMTAIGSKIFVHGGINSTTLYDGFHWLDLDKENQDSTFSWVDSSLIDMSSDKPVGRAAHGIARIMDIQKSSPLFYIFGGIGEHGACNDLWSFNAESMSWSQISKNQEKTSSSFQPVPRLDHAMCAIGFRNESSNNLSVFLMIHGGMSREGEIFNDAWVMKVQ